MEMSTQDMDAFERVVLAGMKIMYDKTTFAHFESGMRKESVPLPQRLATEAAGLMKILMDRSKGSIPPQIIVPAGTMLLMEMAKFMKESGIAEPTSDDVRQGSAMLLKLLEQLFVKGKTEQAPSTQSAPAQPAAPQPAMQPNAGGGLLTQGV